MPTYQSYPTSAPSDTDIFAISRPPFSPDDSLGVTLLSVKTYCQTGVLLSANNLSDLGSASTSRTNLGLGSAAVLNAASTNTASTVVERDGSGNFSAGVISASLNGNASTATIAGSATTAGTLTGLIANDTILANISGSSAPPSAVAVSSILSAIGAQPLNTYLTQISNTTPSAGSLLYYSTTSSQYEASSGITYSDSTGVLETLGEIILLGAATVTLTPNPGNITCPTFTGNLSGNATSATTAGTLTGSIASNTFLGNISVGSAAPSAVTVANMQSALSILSYSGLASGQLVYATGAGAVTSNSGLSYSSPNLNVTGSIAAIGTSSPTVNVGASLQGAIGYCTANTVFFTNTLIGDVVLRNTNSSNIIHIGVGTGVGSQITVSSTTVTINSAIAISSGTINSVTTANVAAGANLANAATNLDTASTIVMRDSSGNFSAGTITAALSGNATSATTATSATSVTGANVVTNSNLAQMGEDTIKGNNTGSPANASDLSVANVLAMLSLNQTANQIAYGNGPSGLTSSSSLTFNGTDIINTAGGIKLLTSGGTPASLNYYETAGTFTLSYSGPGSGTVSVTFVRIGNLVNLFIPNAPVTSSSATFFTCTGLPTRLQPSNAQDEPIWVQDNGTWQTTPGRLLISGSNIYFYKLNQTGNFTGSGTCGWGNKSFTYHL